MESLSEDTKKSEIDKQSVTKEENKSNEETSVKNTLSPEPDDIPEPDDKPEVDDEDDDEELNLQLGDVIEIKAPDDPNLNNKRFYIKYIDEKRIHLVNKEEEQELFFKDDGALRNEAIESIQLLAREEFPGFAKQNNLVPSTWIDIHFGGEFPKIYTGKKTNLEEDQIEIQLIEPNKKIYFDFSRPSPFNFYPS